MASNVGAGQAGEAELDSMWGINQASLKMPRPQIMGTRKDISKKFDERLARFRENCKYLCENREKVSRPNYPKEFLQRLKEAAESFHDLRGPLLARYPMEVSYYFRKQQAILFHELEMAPVLTKHAKELLNELLAKNKLESANERNVLDWCMYLLMNNCFNSLDVAHDLAKDRDYLERICKFLKNIQSKPDKFQHTIARWVIKQIINMCRNPANSKLLRGAKIHKILYVYSKNADPEFCLAALASLAVIMDGKQESDDTDDFELSPDMVDTLMSKIKEAWKSDTKSSTGWPFRELLELVGQLAKNEDNRRVLVARGCLSPLTHLVSSNVLQDELAALRTLWRLALDDANKDPMMENNTLIDTIKDKYFNSNDSNVKGLAYGVLVNLKEKLMESPRHSDIAKILKEREEEVKKKLAEREFEVSAEKPLEEAMGRLEISPDNKALVPKKEARGQIHAQRKGMKVMLSYNREQRPKVAEICLFLVENGFKVWFDQNNMTTDAMDAMAFGIESSDVICICVSQGYYQSGYCEMEAKYSVAKKKRRVFIQMESYEPSGWLGIIKGTAFHVDYTGYKPYPEMRALLVDEILEKRKKEQELMMIEHKPVEEEGEKAAAAAK